MDSQGSSPLGRRVSAPDRYAPELLFPIPRAEARAELGLTGELPFDGVDVWHAYELSWLDERGKPCVATARLSIPATSPALVESKSLKLYLGSLAETRQPAAAEVARCIRADVERVVGAPIDVRLTLPGDPGPAGAAALPGIVVDDLDVSIETYAVDAGLLETEPGAEVSETLSSHVLKTNCPVTGQPDWGSVSVTYRGERILPESFLRYVVSYRGHEGFHEHCVERMFLDLLNRCHTTELSVQACYTRRGGIDINPFRTNTGAEPAESLRWRQ